MAFGPAGMNAWELVYLAGNLPAFIMALIVGFWALRSLYERPRAGWLMLWVVGLTLIGSFGFMQLRGLLSMLSVNVGVGGMLPILVLWPLSLAMAIAIWVLALRAAFSVDEWEMSSAEKCEDDPAGDR